MQQREWLSFLFALVIVVLPTRLLMAEEGTGSSPPAQESVEQMMSAVEWTVQAGDVNLFTLSIGGREGAPTVILIHGGPGFSHHYMEALDVLASEDIRIVTYDQRGVGGSTESTPEAHGLAHHVADLEAIRSSLGVEQVHLLGHSWGGLVAMSYAASYPERVASLILVSSIPPSQQGWTTAQQAYLERQNRLLMEGIIPTPLPLPQGDDCSARMQAVLPVYFADPATQATPELLSTSCHAHILAGTWSVVAGYDLRLQLAGLTIPSLIVHGQDDPFGVQMAEEIVADLTAASPQLVVLPTCGHMPWIECPETFYGALTPFLGATH